MNIYDLNDTFVLEDFFELGNIYLEPYSPLKMYPSEIVKHLDKYVIGQESAKKALAITAANHQAIVEYNTHNSSSLAFKLKKSNLLLVGSTGIGKTLLVESLQSFLP